MYIYDDEHGNGRPYRAHADLRLVEWHAAVDHPQPSCDWPKYVRWSITAIVLMAMMLSCAANAWPHWPAFLLGVLASALAALVVYAVVMAARAYPEDACEDDDEVDPGLTVVPSTEDFVLSNNEQQF